MSRIAIVADPSLFRDCLQEVIRNHENMELVGTANSVDQLDSLSSNLDVVLVDTTSTGALSTVCGVSAQCDGPAVVAYGVPDTEHHIIELLEAGATGCVLEGYSFSDLVEAIKSASRKEVYCKPRVAAALVSRLRKLASGHVSGQCGSTLTERELEIVELLDKGCSNKEIAHRLDIRTATVKNHVHNILEKLNVNRRGEAAALMHGRLSSPLKTHSHSQPR